MDEQNIPVRRQGPFRLETWLVRPTLNQLVQDDKTVHVEPKVMDVLVCLAEADGRVVTREEFMEKVWEGTIVTLDVLSRCISELRKIFSDDASNPRFIETIRKTGYRLLIEPVYVDEVRQSRTSHQVSSRESTPFVFKAENLGVYVWTLSGLLGVIMIGVVGMNWFSDQKEVRMQSVPFTTFPGVELDPDISPDGNQVAFVWNGGEGDNFDLYIKQIGGEKPLRLTEVAGNERSPAWAPNGREIAFVRTVSGDNSLLVIPSLGGNEREIARFEQREIRDVVWSPSGTYMAVSAQKAPYSSFGLYLILSETRELRELTLPPDFHYGDLYPAFSEDEKTIIFVRSILSHVQDIYSVSIESGRIRRLTSKNKPILGLDWDYESDKILFSASYDGISGIWQIDPGGSEPRWLATAGLDSDVRQPTVSRTGSVVMIEQHSSDTNIWRLRRSEQPTRIISSTRWESSPAISNDGQYIAFVSDQSGSYEVWRSDMDGQNILQITNMGGGLISTPTWSPGDSLIAFVSWDEGNANIYLVESVGGKPWPFASADENEISPRFSNDGNWLYYTSNIDGVWQLLIADLHRPGDTLNVIKEQAIAGMEAPDGDSFFYVKPYERGLWEYTADPDTSILLFDNIIPTDRNNWSVVGRGIYFIDREVPSISYYSLTTRKVTPIAWLQDLPSNHSFAAAPDGSWFVFSRIEDAQSDILLLEEEAGS